MNIDKVTMLVVSGAYLPSGTEPPKTYRIEVPTSPPVTEQMVSTLWHICQNSKDVYGFAAMIGIIRCVLGCSLYDATYFLKDARKE